MLTAFAFLLVVAVTQATDSSVFNDTITFWADDLSPMVVFPWFTSDSEEDWLYRSLNGERYPSLSGSLEDGTTASYAFNFVGTGFSIEGGLDEDSGTVRVWNERAAGEEEDKDFKFSSHIDSVTTLVEEDVSAFPRAWHGRVNVPSEDEPIFTFQAMRFRVPILTQAYVQIRVAPDFLRPPDLLVMQPQSHVVLISQNKQVTKSINVTTISPELDSALVEAGYSSRKDGDPASADEKMVEDGVLWLSKNSELSYKIPKNTTLVEVLGPVGVHGTLGDDRQECVAHLEPPPFWWTKKRLPFSASLKTQNRVKQTLFLLPLDPTVEHKLYVTSSHANVTCRVSHIRAYPFH